MIKVIQFNERILIFREINDAAVSRDSWIHSGPHKSSHPQIMKQTRHVSRKERKRKMKKKDVIPRPPELCRDMASPVDLM